MTIHTVDDLRAAWLATISAADRAGAQLHGQGHPAGGCPGRTRSPSAGGH
ncbi:hypothetical protein NKG94_47960 [Micromonospora sp. M12]